ncbi:MAG TPA: NADH-ubiquinone oxidoreductase-F iron-sulfur binding region domain-containing protein [Vicinamibacterales bacterium]|nr:NADH-ubiquinone oxidoreductase-F iron-sulfur binding region domain-containing protein [Vicinamibacterales bacterium]
MTVVRSKADAVLLGVDPVESWEAYVASGGGMGLANALALGPTEVVSAVTKARLRGRGGGGFPTGIKWASVAQDACPTKYVVCNGAEGEPGTFKDRYLLRRNPYQMLEGLAIAAYAVGARRAYVCLKKSFVREIARVRRAVKEMSAARCLGDVTVDVVLGPEDYLFGEEKAMLEVIEGGLAMPREADLPPYVHGLFVVRPDRSNPTVVNNVETLSNIPHIFCRGADWFRSIGTPDTPGTMVFTISGDVATPGVFELPMGTPVDELVYEHGGGMRPGRKVKAVLSGVSNAVIQASALRTRMDFGSMQAIGSGLGSGGFVVFDDSACMVRVAYKLSEFLHHESCGQCTPCKFGTNQATEHLRCLVEGAGGPSDLSLVLEGAAMAPYANRCYLPVEHSVMVPSLVRAFAAEFEQHFGRGCQGCRNFVVPKFKDFDERSRVFVYAAGNSTVVDS